MPASTPAPRSVWPHCRSASRSRSRACSSLPDPAPMDKSARHKSADTVTLTVHSAITEIPAAEWYACAGDINPTLSHIFLGAMEESGSATGRAGWAPQHLSLADDTGRIVGIVPLYLKSHSYGEY